MSILDRLATAFRKPDDEPPLSLATQPTADDVRNGYRFILGRNPESDDVVRSHRGQASVADLRHGLLSSREFRDQGFMPPPKAYLAHSPAEDVQTAADEDELRAMVAKTGEYWASVGRTAPHWSVLTEEKYAPESLSENEDAFFDSGAADRDLLLCLLRRIGRAPADFRRCVEYGCGVGRDTLPLAATFREVVGLDISQPHLDVAQQKIASANLANVRLMHVTPDDLMPASDYDLWFSRLVLQHNPPPVTLAILDKAFSQLASGGVAIIHLPTYCDGYSFNVANYLASPIGQNMEMHATPQRVILDLAFSRNCRLREIHEEPGHRIYITNLFVFQKT